MVSYLEGSLKRNEANVILNMPEDELRTYDQMRLDYLRDAALIRTELDVDAALSDGEVLQKWHLPLLIWITADGGADHNIKHLASTLTVVFFGST